MNYFIISTNSVFYFEITMKEIEISQNKIRVPGADEPKDSLEVFKAQIANFSKPKTLYNLIPFL